MKKPYFTLSGGFFILVALLFITGCKKDLMKEKGPQSSQSSQSLASDQFAEGYTDGVQTVLGDEYPIPFSISAMKTAKLMLDSMEIKSPVTLDIRTTHFYVKFSPTNMAQLETLEDDSTLILSDVPLNYKIKIQGSWYRDPTIPANDSIPSPHYGVVKKDYGFPPSVPYTIIEELYVPDEDPLLIGDDDPGGKYYGDMLIYAAFIGQQLPEISPFLTVPDPFDYEVIGGEPTPTGVIRIFDSRLDTYIPMEGVKVIARKHFWGTARRTGHTDANGSYEVNGSQVSGLSTYTIYFEKHDFVIKDNRASKGKVVRHRENKDHWSYDIELGYECMQGHMFRAAYRYYYKDVDGLKRPFRYLHRQRLIAKDQEKDWAGLNYTFFPVLKVARYWDEGEYDSDATFSTTIHELAHVSHVLTMNSPFDFSYVANYIVESWATAIEWKLTQKEYRELGISNYGSPTYYDADVYQPHRYAYQYWAIPIYTDPEYTSLFINLVDDYNEFGHNYGTNQEPLITTLDDRVSGYDFSFIQSNFLKNIYGTASLSTKLKEFKPAGVTDADIDLLLSFY